MKKLFEVYHTSPLLRKHKLVAHQKGDGPNAKLRYVDWKTHKPASEKRMLAFEIEDAETRQE